MEEWIDRTTALARMGIRPQTLYAYVSRGRIGMQPDPDDPRRSLYSANDIEALKVRRARGKGRAAVANSTMAWGEPSLETAISTVHRGRLIYRGTDAVSLSDHASWEEATTLLWRSNRPVSLTATSAVQDNPFSALATLVPESWSTLGRGEDKLHGDGVAAIATLADALGAAPSPGPLHERIAQGWSLPNDFRDPLRRALVLLADHELNASTFAIRVAASTGAPIAACLLAGLSALSGPRHGGAGAAAIALLDSARRSGPKAALKEILASGRHLPGFGHPLYPGGDPRGAALLPVLPIDALIEDLLGEAVEMSGLEPNIDFALAVLARSGPFPDDMPFRLFALGRSAGWLAHAVEQISSGRLIRPRAHYVGELPNS